MNNVYINLLITVLFSIALFLYMHKKQKKKEESADRIFNLTMESIERKYRSNKGENNDISSKINKNNQ